MAYGMEAGYVPGGFEATVSAPGPAVQGNEDILDFLRQMQFRQQRSQRLARRPGLAQRPQAAPAVSAPATERDNSQDSFLRQMRALQLQAAMEQANQGGVWRKNGIFGEQNVSPGTIGAYRVQAGY